MLEAPVLGLDRGRIVLDGIPETIYRDHPDEVKRLGLWNPADQAQSALSLPAAEATPGSQPAELSIAGVGVRVSGREILRETRAYLPRGSVALVTGDNGTGKTTLLRTLATQLRPSTGRITPRTRARVRAGIGAAPQRAADLLLKTTVLEELCSVLAHGKAREQMSHQEAARELLDQAGLREYEHAHPLRLSGGQRQRLAVTLAVASLDDHDPALVLLDEPTSAQDQRGAQLVLDLIEARTRDRVTLIATHEPWRFERIASCRIHLERAPIGEDDERVSVR